MQILEQFDLRAFNSFALPAKAGFFAELTEAEQLPELLAFAEQNQLPFIILGGGSNSIFTKDYPGLVIRMALRGIHIDNQGEQRLLTVAAGESWPALVEYSLRQRCYGLENLSLIPGSVGAAPIQNIGAYGVELERVFQSLRGWDLQQQCWRMLSKADCVFGYRDSAFKHTLKGQFVITEVTLALSAKASLDCSYQALRQALVEQGVEQATPQQVADTVIAVRNRKLPNPADLPNAGSFFKNPVIPHEQASQLLAEYPTMPHYPQADGQVKLAAGWLIDQAGWKGKREGDVGCHDQQALVLVNYGHATGQQLLAFATDIQTDIKRRFAVQLEIEPTVY